MCLKDNYNLAGEPINDIMWVPASDGGASFAFIHGKNKRKKIEDKFMSTKFFSDRQT